MTDPKQPTVLRTVARRTAYVAAWFAGWVAMSLAAMPIIQRNPQVGAGLGIGWAFLLFMHARRRAARRRAGAQGARQHRD